MQAPGGLLLRCGERGQLLRGDFGEIDQEVLQVSTANTRSYGGGMQIAPAADPGDGLFDRSLVDLVDETCGLRH